MPISIQCGACHRQYNVGDNLVGKKVKCRECGEAITVQDPNAAADPDILAIDDSPAVAAAGPSAKRCPSCRTPNALTALRCTACGYTLRAEPAVVVEENIPLAAKAATPKKRKFVRTPDHPTLASIDSLVNLIIWWGSIAALAVWIVHIAKSPAGISPLALLPVGLVIVLGAVIIAPLMSIAIKVAAHFLPFIPRNDTYNRVMLTLLLPFAASLLAGWPSLNPSLAATIATLAAVISPVLFIYLFRSEIKEWGSTVGAGLLGMFVGWYVALFVASIAASATGPLYADMLPAGPWKSFATGESPAPAPVKTDVAAATTAPTTIAATQTTPDAPIAAALVPAAPVTAPVVAEGVVISKPAAPTHNAKSLFTPPGTGTPDPAAVAPAPQTNFFAEVQADEQNLLDVREAIPAFLPSSNFLVVKGSDAGGTVTVERWSVQPLAKKGTETFQELPDQPNAYAVSPQGGTLVAVINFPRHQIQISNFDTKVPPHTVNFPADKPDAIPSLVGFLDTTHYCVRWTLHGIVNYQVWNTFPSTSHMIVPAMEPGPNNVAFSPNGRWLATVAPGPMGVPQIILYNAETGMVIHRISPTSETFKSAGLAFSPDSSQIAVCAVLGSATSVLTFKVQGGTMIASQLLNTTSPPSTIVAIAHPDAKETPTTPGLLWLQNGLAWLVDGNDLYETTAGKNIGSLNLPDVVDVQLAGTDSVLILQKNADNTKKLVVAKWDDAAIKAAADKVK
jgi:hypothetical protein